MYEQPRYVAVADLAQRPDREPRYGRTYAAIVGAVAMVAAAAVFMVNVLSPDSYPQSFDNQPPVASDGYRH